MTQWRNATHDECVPRAEAAGRPYPYAAEVRSLIDAIERELNDVGPWGNGYRQALADLRRQLDLRFGKSAPSATPEGGEG